MQPLLQNKYIKFTLIGVATLVLIFIFLVMMASLNVSRSNVGFSSNSIAPMGMPDMDTMMVDDGYGYAGEVAMRAEESMVSSYMPTPSPEPNGYTSGLEKYETASYSVTAKTREFDAFCATLAELKASPDIDFKNLNSATNYCRATFYTDEANAPSVVAALQQFSGVDVSRSVVSVTRHRQQIESRSAIITQQLASVNRSLAIAETEFDQIAAFARTQNDAETLAETIREKLNLIEMLTQRKISLTSQLDNIAQQAADLDERIDVVEFYVSANRLTPVVIGEKERKWEMAWKELSDTFTDTLIGLTAAFGVFLLWVVRITLYLLVVLLAIRGLWKFVQFIWKRW